MRKVVLTVLGLALCWPAGAGAQERAEAQDDEVVELETTLVEVPVVVSERGGRYVVDLRQEDFATFEDGVEQEIGFFAAVDEPFNVALMIDTSGSTRDKLDRIRDAASAFLDQLRPHDRVVIVAFEEEVTVLSPLTSDRALLRRSLAGLAPGGYTQVYEAVHVVAEELLAEVAGRKAAILFSDGVDTASAISTYDDSIDEIGRQQIIVYPIRYNTRPDVEERLGVARVADVDASKAEATRRGLEQAYTIADDYLAELADVTGGVLHRADALDDLPAAFARIAAELRNQYMLGYYPIKRDVPDAARRITVKVSRPGLVVRSRQGYRPRSR
jgi:VWFA-related protein